MIKSKKFALAFRSLAVVLTILSILSTMGAFRGEIHWDILRYYTLQSNILVLAVFVYLTVATARSIILNGWKGDACFSPRLCAAAVICIMLTFGVFWGTLAPRFENPADLWKFSNNGVHLFVPLLMLADYIMFTIGGRLKKYDPFLFSVVPLVYLIFATIMGFAGATYGTDADGNALHFPYFFIDYYNTGWWCAVYITAFIVIYMGLGFLMYFIDTKRRQRNK